MGKQALPCGIFARVCSVFYAFTQLNTVLLAQRGSFFSKFNIAL